MTLTILYGSQTGTAERLAFRVARMALKRGATAIRVLPADDTSLADWRSYGTGEGQHVVFLVANANQGEAPETYRRSWAQLLSRDAPSMEGLSYAVFGLGDSLYAKFNYMAKMTHNRLRQLGGVPLLLRGLGDESDAKGLDDVLLPWLTQLWAVLGYATRTIATTDEEGEDVARLQPQQPLDAAFFPLYKVEMNPAPVTTNTTRTADSTRMNGTASAVYSDATAVASAPREHDTFLCTVSSNTRLTATDHYQAVHHLELQCGKTAQQRMYEVGDALGVYCPNRKAQVDYTMAFCGLDEAATLRITPNAEHGIIEQTKRPFFGKCVSARYFFTHYVDLDAVTEQDFFWMMSFYVCEQQKKQQQHEPTAKVDGEQTLEEEYVERLRELANPVNPDDFLVYSYREKRNVCEVLLDYNISHDVQVRPPLEAILSFMTPMRPRLFSISSSPVLDAGNRLSLTVAKLDWATPMQRHRQGLCSSALASAEVGRGFQCFFWEGTLTLPPQPTPLLLVATGSGIAPMRALLRHCAAFAAQGWAEVPIYLCFGCRHEMKDFLYAEEWRALAAATLRGLVVLPAFSRDDPRTKVYVQHKLGQNAVRVGALLSTQPSGAAVYVCGNAKNMPKDVQSVLQGIVDKVCCGGEEEQGRLFMKRMQQEGRYQVDTWSS